MVVTLVSCSISAKSNKDFSNAQIISQYYVSVVSLDYYKTSSCKKYITTPDAMVNLSDVQSDLLKRTPKRYHNELFNMMFSPESESKNASIPKGLLESASKTMTDKSFMCGFVLGQFITSHEIFKRAYLELTF